MALLTAVSVTATASTAAPASAGTSNTIAAADIGTNGALLNIINGSGGSINVTLADPGFSPVGGVGTATAQAVANSTDRWFRLSPGHVDPTSQVATVTLSSASSVTYKLIKA